MQILVELIVLMEVQAFLIAWQVLAVAVLLLLYCSTMRCQLVYLLLITNNAFYFIVVVVVVVGAAAAGVVVVVIIIIIIIIISFIKCQCVGDFSGTDATE